MYKRTVEYYLTLDIALVPTAAATDKIALAPTVKLFGG